MRAHMRTRESWLLDAVSELGSRKVEPASFKMPSKVYVSVGFPRGRAGNKGPAIGQCWPRVMSGDKAGHIFISPVLADPVDVLAVLLHEIGHDVVGCEHGHKKPFADFCKAVDLVKPWTATTPSDVLRPELEKIAERLGEYPHALLTPGTGLKKQTTRMRLYQCPQCEQKLRAATDELNVLCGDCDTRYERR